MKTITQKQVLDAIKDSGGIYSTIARRLKCNWNTARTYCDKWESTKTALQDEIETTLDNAEIKLLDAIKAGDTQIIKWYLSTKGKHRGYTTKIETTVTDENAEPLHIIFDGLDTITREDLENCPNVEMCGGE